MSRSRTVLALVVGVVIGLVLAGTPALAVGGDLAAKAFALAKKADKRSKQALDKASRPGPAGATGATGAAGPPGQAGPAVLPRVYVARTPGTTVITAESSTGQGVPLTPVITMTIPAGTYLVTAGATTVGSGRLTCSLVANGVAQVSRRSTGATSSTINVELPLSMNGPVTVSGATPLAFSCFKNSGPVSLDAPIVTAVRVGEATEVPAS